MVPARLAAWYFGLQAIAVVAWWAVLMSWPAFRGVFELGDRAVLQSFLLPDVGFGLASLLAARLTMAGHRASAPVAGVTVGAVGYSTVMTYWHVAVADAGVVGAIAMTCATAASAVSLRALYRRAG